MKFGGNNWIKQENTVQEKEPVEKNEVQFAVVTASIRKASMGKYSYEFRSFALNPRARASYLWRGYGLLKPFSSHWQILAHSNSFIDQEAEGPVWLVTYFTKTLFTKAGIDLYVRETLSETLYREILQKLKSHHGEDPSTKELCELASEMFRIPHGNV